MKRYLQRLDAETGRLPVRNTVALRGVRRRLSRELESESPEQVLKLALALVRRNAPADRFFAYEFIVADRRIMPKLRATTVRALGQGIDNWADVDTFSCYVSGPAWREGQLTDRELARWASSRDRWWRRAALVSTVALNCRARGGRGDARRTIALCAKLVADRDPMVVKALSWSLRELAKRDSAAVEYSLLTHRDALATLVRREVESQLQTGRKRRPRPRLQARIATVERLTSETSG